MINYKQWRSIVEERLKAKKGPWVAIKTGRHYADDDFWEIKGDNVFIGDEFGGLLDGATAKLITLAPDDLQTALDLIDIYRTALIECGRFGYWGKDTSRETLIETLDHITDTANKALDIPNE